MIRKRPTLAARLRGPTFPQRWRRNPADIVGLCMDLVVRAQLMSHDAAAAAARLERQLQLRQHGCALWFEKRKIRACLKPSAELDDPGLLRLGPALGVQKLRIEFVRVLPSVRRPGKPTEQFSSRRQGFAATNSGQG